MRLRKGRTVLTGLDLFSGAGGCTAGYVRAARKADVLLIMVGIDRKHQPRYPLSGGLGFIQDDVFKRLSDRTFMRQFDFIHASPPCGFFTALRTLGNTAGQEDLLTPLRPWMKVYDDVPWIIENVEKCSLLVDPLVLCGSMFPGLHGKDPRRQLRRHRKFEITGFEVPQPVCRHNGIRPLGVYGSPNARMQGGGDVAANLGEASSLMGIDWMKWPELKEAIPPQYTEYIGDYLFKELLAA
jgi:DNA (cytosine-5)-methyltransferase 1